MIPSAGGAASAAGALVVELPSEKSHQRRMLAQPDSEKTTRKRAAALRAEYFMFLPVLAALLREGTGTPGKKSRSMGRASDLPYDHNTNGLKIPNRISGNAPGQKIYTYEAFPKLQFLGKQP
jgi:hypothetical protein